MEDVEEELAFKGVEGVNPIMSKDDEETFLQVLLCNTRGNFTVQSKQQRSMIFLRTL